MPSIQRQALVPYSADQMFSLVNDIAAYPEFLPWCQSSEVLSSSEKEMLARLTVRKAAITRCFTTRNQLEAPGRIIMALEDGPFTHFSGTWTFKALSEAACSIELTMSFELASGWMNAMLGQIFTAACQKMVDAFCQRADEVYARV